MRDTGFRSRPEPSTHRNISSPSVAGLLHLEGSGREPLVPGVGKVKRVDSELHTSTVAQRHIHQTVIQLNTMATAPKRKREKAAF